MDDIRVGVWDITSVAPLEASRVQFARPALEHRPIEAGEGVGA